MSKGGRFAKNNAQNTEKKKTGGFAKVLIALGVVLVLALAGVVGMTVYQYTMVRMAANKPTVPTLPPETIAVTEPVETEPVETEPTVPATTEPLYEASGKDIINFMLIGDSAREGEDSRLADTQMLVTVNKIDKTLTLTSFQRDTWLKLADYEDHDCGKGRINLAYHLGYKWGGVGGGIKMVSDTIEQNFGAKIDHSVIVDFDIFMELVNMLGGVRVHLNEDEAKYLNKDLNQHFSSDPYHFEDTTGKDKVSLDGMAALSYARMRHSNGGDSDIKRTARQRAVITDIVKSLMDMSFSEIEALTTELLPMVTTDMTKEQIKTCMFELIPILPQLTINQQSIPAPDTYWSIEIEQGGITTYPLEFKPKENREIVMKIAEADQLAVQPAG